MKTTSLVACLLMLCASCATTMTSSTTWTDPGTGGYPYGPPRAGRVASVREVVQRVQGDPVGGALAGAIIGGLITGGRGPERLFGAATGAAIGAAASQGSAETRSYEVEVRFDDGSAGMFVYQGYSPFWPGQAVVLTPQGLAPA